MLIGDSLRDVDVAHARLQGVERGSDRILGDLDRAPHPRDLFGRLHEPKLLEHGAPIDQPDLRQRLRESYRGPIVRLRFDDDRTAGISSGRARP